MEDDSQLLELPKDNMQEYLHARKQQCIQQARSEEALHLPYFFKIFSIGTPSLKLNRSLTWFHAAGVFEKAITYYRNSAPELKEERAMLLEEWLNMETSFGEFGDVSLVQSKLPKKLKKRRQIVSEDGPAGYVTNLMFMLWFHCYLADELSN